MDFKFELKATGEILTSHGIDDNGMAQQIVDSEVLRLTAGYVPLDTGMLMDSGALNTVIGSGEVVYKTPYARRQYYENKGSGKRGKQWFERMKADHRDDILKAAKKGIGTK